MTRMVTLCAVPVLATICPQYTAYYFQLMHNMLTFAICLWIAI